MAQMFCIQVPEEVMSSIKQDKLNSRLVSCDLGVKVDDIIEFVSIVSFASGVARVKAYRTVTEVSKYVCADGVCDLVERVHFE